MDYYHRNLPEDLHDRSLLLAAHWHTTLWFVLNLALRIGIDQLEQYLLENPKFVPESRVDWSQVQSDKTKKRRTGKGRQNVKFKIGEHYYV